MVAVTASGCGLLGPGGSDEPLADCRARTTGEIRLQRTSLLPLLRSVDRSSVTSSTTCEDTDESDPRGYLTVRAVPGATADQLLAPLRNQGWTTSPDDNIDGWFNATGTVDGSHFRVWVHPAIQLSGLELDSRVDSP